MYKMLALAVVVMLGLTAGCGTQEQAAVAPAAEPQAAAPAPVEEPVAQAPVTEAARAEVEVAVEAPEPERRRPRGANLTLRFNEGDKATYRVAWESSRTAHYEGPLLSKEPKLRSGKTGIEIEMLYEQEILELEEDGSAIAKVTVRELKFHETNQDVPGQQFDSAVDTGQPLAGVVGQAYQIRLFPDGRAEARDAATIRSAAGTGTARQIAVHIFSDDEIARRHGIGSLPKDGERKAPGATWSATAPAPRGMLDTRPFEKVYTLEEIAREDDKRVATIAMQAIPSSQAGPADMQQAMIMGALGGMMDRQDDYTGTTKIDLRTGALLEYKDSLNTVWVATDPEARSDAEPDRITMIFVQKQVLEKID